MKRTLATSVVLIAVTITTPAHADVIAVIDGQLGTANAVVFDRSTNGDTAAGITGTFATTEAAFPGSEAAPNTWWDTDTAFLQPGVGTTTGSGDVGTWTFNGLTNGLFNVYASWRQQAQFNLATNAPYQINGGAAILKNHSVGPAANLTLNDTTPFAINFELLGQVSVTGNQIVVTVSDGAANNFVGLDAIAIQSVPTPAALPAGLALIGLVAARRRRRIA